MNLTLTKKGIVASLLGVLVVVMLVGWLVRLVLGVFSESEDREPMMVACDTDTRMCADGTLVARQGEACEFAACPKPDVSAGTFTEWGRYENERFGFTLSYPPFWDLTEEGNDRVTFSSETFSALGELQVYLESGYQADTAEGLHQQLTQLYDYRNTYVGLHQIGPFAGVEVVPLSHADSQYTFYLVLDSETILTFAGNDVHRGIISPLKPLP